MSFAAAHFIFAFRYFKRAFMPPTSLLSYVAKISCLQRRRRYYYYHAPQRREASYAFTFIFYYADNII